MSGYDAVVAPLERNVIESKAFAWRSAFGVPDAWVIDLARILEIEMPRVLPNFALRIRAPEDMQGEEARTFHAVPAIDMREDVYARLCEGDGRARFTAAHELGHLFLHNGESRPRAVQTVRWKTISRKMSSEGQADDFAASLLMPEHIVRQFSGPAQLAEGCHVSTQAALVRMKELRLWPKARPPIPEVEEFLRKMKADKSKR